MKTKRIYQGIALLAVALTTAACQNELKEESSEPKPGEKVNMTIRATQGTTPQTRTSYEDKLGGTPIDGIVVKWEGEDGTTKEEINVFGYEDNPSEFTDCGTLSSEPSSLSDNGFSINFTGDVKPAVNYLAVYGDCMFDVGSVFFDFFTETYNPTQDCNNPMAHLKDLDIMIGKPAATGTNNYTFVHKAIMLRFDLTLPQEESVNRITLNTTGTGGIAPYASISIMKDEDEEKEIDDLKFDPTAAVEEVSLGITNHKASTLKAYMMVPYIDVDNATLTITVNTASNKTYTGKLVTNANTKLLPGLCYTLKPNTLTLSNTVTVPPVIEGGLEAELDKITSLDPKQTELVVTGTVKETDLTALATFLKDGNGSKITTLDLSGITIANSAPVTGLAACTKITTVVLPDEAEAIGDNAFDGCIALTTVIQKETAPAANTRASMPSRVKTVGKEAFKNCTSMTEMFLHANITSVGNKAFEGCTALTALVFEGKNSVGTGGITLGADIVKGLDKVAILLPKITDSAVATTYKTALGKDTYYNYSDYDTAEEKKLDITNYTKLSNDPGATSPGLSGGTNLGGTN